MPWFTAAMADTICLNPGAILGDQRPPYLNWEGGTADVAELHQVETAELTKTFLAFAFNHTDALRVTDRTRTTFTTRSTGFHPVNSDFSEVNNIEVGVFKYALLYALCKSSSKICSITKDHIRDATCGFMCCCIH